MKEHPGRDGAAVRLTLGDGGPTASAAAAKVHARFDVSGEVRIYVAADYSMYPANLAQEFSVTVRFSSGPASADSTYAPWVFDEIVRAEAFSPSFQILHPGRLTVQRVGMGLSPNQTIEMRLIDARWSLRRATRSQPSRA